MGEQVEFIDGFFGKLGDTKCVHCGSETVSYGGIINDHECGTAFYRLSGKNSSETRRCVEVQRDRLRERVKELEMAIKGTALIAIYRMERLMRDTGYDGHEQELRQVGRDLRNVIIKAALPGEVLPYEKGGE